MIHKDTLSRRLFLVFNYIFLMIVAFTCLFPIINVLAISFSKSWAVTAGIVKLWPVGFTLNAYKYVFSKPEFSLSLIIALKRVLLGVTINMLLTVLSAYPLSKEKHSFRHRKIYVWYFLITILFSGGLIPWYMVINKLGLIDKIWALVIPGAIPVFNVILLMNFFRELPKDIEESAFVDGASYWKSLWFIYIPISKPALATITLFCLVNHWNSWFDGMLLMNSPKNYPLQSYLRTVVIQIDIATRASNDLKSIAEISDRTSKAAQIFIAAFPIIMVYPFLQKYFTKGIILGSVKG